MNNDTTTGVSVLTLSSKLSFPHNGKLYSFTDKKIPARLGLPKDFTASETRAAVGLLTRSIRIVSGGDSFDQDFLEPPVYKNPPDPPYNSDFSNVPFAANKGYYFGGHLIFRQGFRA